jgi:hypothetical protein
MIMNKSKVVNVRMFMQEAVSERVQKELSTNGFGSQDVAKDTNDFLKFNKGQQTIWKWNR